VQARKPALNPKARGIHDHHYYDIIIHHPNAQLDFAHELNLDVCLSVAVVFFFNYILFKNILK
jgi:hypothetical protein